MLRGVEWGDKRRLYKATVASKLHEVLVALATMAQVSNMPALAQEIGRVAIELYNSGELVSDLTGVDHAT